MNRRNFLKQCAMTTGGLTLAGSALGANTILKNNSVKVGKNNTQPNVLFIFADDQCYDTIRALGNDEVSTPNLDRLVRNGTTFTHAYNMGAWGAAVCVASRTMLNTGRFVWNANNVNPSTELNAGRFWGPLMKQAGYETYFSGKWHVSASSSTAFDHVVHERPGMPNQTSSGYYRPKTYGDPWAEWDPTDTSKGGFWSGGKHWSEVLGDDAETFLNQAGQSDNPFFMYLAFNAPHDPRQSPQKYVDKYPWQDIEVPDNFLPNYPYDSEIGCGPTSLRDEQLAPSPRTEFSVKVNRQEYYAIITHMDHQIGRILEALEKTGKADNTYIFFTADHGLACGQHGLLGKQNMYDHSIRPPLLVCGPGVAANSKIDAKVYLQDIMPTSLELAGAQVPSFVQFKSLLPLMQGKKQQSYDSIYCGYLSLQRMVIQGDYKLILYPNVPKKRLYNLAADPQEMNDLSGDPQYLQTMKDLFAEFRQLQTETGDTLNLTGTFSELL